MVSVNLIPAATQAAHRQKRRLKVWGAMALVSAGLLAVPLAVNWYQSFRAAELTVENERLQQRLTTTRLELRALTTSANQLLQQLNRARALRAKRAWSGMIALVGANMPQGCWLKSIATDPGAPTGTGSKSGRASDGDIGRDGGMTVTIDAPRKMRLTGYATDAAEPHRFVANLKNTQVFSRIALEHSRREPVLDDHYFLFELVCEW